MKRLVSICDWLPPDFGAVGQYAEIEARRVAAEGADVTLIGLSSSADESKDEKIGKGTLRTVRLLVRPYERANFRQRALWTAATNGRLLRRAWKYAKAADEVLFTGSPPFFLHWIVPANLLLRKRLVYRITDFHPECLLAELGQRPLWLQLFLYWTLFLRRRVHHFEVLGEDQKWRLLEIGIPEDRIYLRRDEAPVEITSHTEPLELPEPLRDKVVLLYSGNFGVAHDDVTFVEGYARHHREGSGRVVLWLNATGAKADRVEAALRERRLPFHRSRPVALAELPRLLVTPHAHLITLRDEFVGYVLPSKVYGCIASGRSVLFVGSADSDVHLLCSERLGGRGGERGVLDGWADGSAGGAPVGSPASEPQRARYRRVSVGDAAGVARALDELVLESLSRAGKALAPEVPARDPRALR